MDDSPANNDQIAAMKHQIDFVWHLSHALST